MYWKQVIQSNKYRAANETSDTFWICLEDLMKYFSWYIFYVKGSLVANFLYCKILDFFVSRKLKPMKCLQYRGVKSAPRAPLRVARCTSRRCAQTALNGPHGGHVLTVNERTHLEIALFQ